MSAFFGPRRKAKIIALDNDDAAEDAGPTVVKRPSRPKPRASRISFQAGAADADDAEDADSGNVVKPKRGLARKSGLPSSLAADRLPVRQHDEEHEKDGLQRPSYSKEALAELKSAQQARPANTTTALAADSNPPPGRDLDVASKFGTTLANYQQRESSSLIPTDAEIQEKKERRARLARLARYNIDSDDSDGSASEGERHGRNSDEDEFLTHRDKISLRDARADRTKEVDTRLVRDDEDLMEGFEAFTGEGQRVALGESAQRDAQVKHRAQIRDMIDAAQQESADEDEDDENDGGEHDMRHDYETLQARKGAFSASGAKNGRPGHVGDDRAGARTPPRITPIPTLASCVERLRGKLLEMDTDRSAKQQRMQELQAEKEDIAQREVDIQKLLAETAAKYEQLGREAGLAIDMPASDALDKLRLEAQPVG